MLTSFSHILPRITRKIPRKLNECLLLSPRFSVSNQLAISFHSQCFKCNLQSDRQMIKRKNQSSSTSVAPTTCQIFTCVLLFLQIIGLIVSQTIIEPHDDNHLGAGATQANDLELSTESSKDYFDCPHCNILSEVSRRVNQLAFHANFKMTRNSKRMRATAMCAIT